MKMFALTAVIVVAMTGTATAADNATNRDTNGNTNGGTNGGMIAKQSPHSVESTAQRLEDAVKAKGLKVFPRIDHAAAAREAGLEMPPTVVVAFGNPKYGTPLMLDQPQAGIDFPPRAIVYEDQTGQVWLAYNSADYFYNTIFARHGLGYSDKEVAGLTTLLEGLSEAAVKPAP